MKRSPVIGLLTIVALAGGAFIYLPYLQQAWSISPWGDTVHLTGPLFCEISRSIKAGAAPLMNWSTFEALDYNPHVATYYPFYLFGTLDFCSAAAAAQAADIILVVHAGIFALTMASLIRATGVPPLMAIAGGAVAATVANVTTLGTFPTFIAAAAWLPMAVEGFVRLYSRRQYLLGALLLAIGTSAMLTAGPGTNMLAPLVFIGLIASIDVIVRLISAGDRHGARSIIVALLAAAALTAVLSLASTINLFLHLGEIVRWTRSGAVVGNASPGNISEILVEKLGWSDLPQLIVPLNTTYATGYYFLGPSLVFLAVAGALLRWREPLVRLFGLVAVISILIVFLLPGFIVLVWALIPGLSHTRHLSLLATPLALSVAVLAAHGANALLRDVLSPRQRLILVSISAFLLIATAAAVFWAHHLRVFGSPGLAVAALLTPMVVAMAAIAVQPGPLRGLALVGLVGLHNLAVYQSTPYVDGMPTVAKSELWRSLSAALQFIRATDPDPGRIAIDQSVGGDGLTYMNSGTLVTYADLMTFTHYTSPRIFWKFEHEIGLVGSRDFGRYGGKYLLTSTTLPLSIGREIFRDGKVGVVRLDKREPMIATLCSLPEGFSPSYRTGQRPPAGQLGLLDDASALRIGPLGQENAGCPAAESVSSWHLNRSAGAIDFWLPDGPQRLLVISLPPYLSWQLWVGDQRIPLYNRSGRQLIALIRAESSGQARLVYMPNAFRWRLRISVVGWILALSALCTAIVGGPPWHQAFGRKKYKSSTSLAKEPVSSTGHS